MNGDFFNRRGGRAENGVLSAKFFTPDAAPWLKSGTGILPVMTARYRKEADATPDFSVLNFSGLF